jgi:hypothetical protein
MVRGAWRDARTGTALLIAATVVMAVLQAPAISQTARLGDDARLTYARGQSIAPVFHGWLENADGTFDLYFSYINRNWQEELDIPIGPDNNIQPAPFGPDGGQPTHFFPRVNRWVFAVRVPKDFGTKEIVWTLTAHGQTFRAYGTLNPGYAVDDFLIMHEFGNSLRGRKRPTLQVEGEKQRTAKVGQRVPLVAIATDPNPSLKSTGDPPAVEGGSVGGDFVRGTARGLRLAWFVYRGPAAHVKFDPPIPFRVWEDQRGGSPWSPGWRPPPIPPGNRWVHNVSFQESGTYVLRAQAHDGFQFTNEDITFTVTP